MVLMPDSKILSVWNVIMMILLLYTATYIPFKTAYIETETDLVGNIELATDALFFMDVIFNFLSAYELPDKNVEFRMPRIAINYITSWFLIDCVSCIPF